MSRGLDSVLLALVIRYSSEVQQPTHATTIMSGHLHTRQAARLDCEQDLGRRHLARLARGRFADPAQGHRPDQDRGPGEAQEAPDRRWPEDLGFLHGGQGCGRLGGRGAGRAGGQNCPVACGPAPAGDDADREPSAAGPDRSGCPAHAEQPGPNAVHQDDGQHAQRAGTGYPARRGQRSRGPERRAACEATAGQDRAAVPGDDCAEAAALLAAAKNHPRLGAYVILSLTTGIRIEEARALRWDHVDLEGDPDARTPVPPSVAVWRSVRLNGDTKTEKSRRTWPCRRTP
jgi:hypothetical protein